MGVYVPKPEEMSADNRDALECWRRRQGEQYVNALALHEAPRAPRQVTKLIDMFVKLQQKDPDQMNVVFTMWYRVVNPLQIPRRGHRRSVAIIPS